MNRHHDVLVALLQSTRLATAVPMALAVVERDPLASAGQFSGDLVRALMEVPGSFWVRHPVLFARYRAALRASALRRRSLPLEQRLEFWGPLSTGGPSASPEGGGGQGAGGDD